MSQPTTKSNASLSIPALLVFYLGAPGLIYEAYLLSSLNIALIIPLTFLPTAIFYKKWRDANTTAPSRRAPLEPLLWTSFITFIVLNIFLGPLSLITMLLMAVVFDVIGEGDDGGFLTDLSSWQTWAFILTMALVVAIMEGSMKYLPIAYAKRRHRRMQKKLQKEEQEDHERSASSGPTEKDSNEDEQEHRVACRSQHQSQYQFRDGDRAYLDFALASALFMGVYEAVGNITNNKDKSNGAIAMAVFERITACIGHILWILPTALRAIRRDFSPISSSSASTGQEQPPTKKMGWWSVSGLGMVLHGINDFFAFGTVALHNSGWVSLNDAFILASVRVVVVYAIAIRVARRELKLLNDGEREGEKEEGIEAVSCRCGNKGESALKD